MIKINLLATSPGAAAPREWLPREQELLAAAAERCLMAAEKARLMEDLAHREEQVRRLAEHMLHVEEIERRRISWNALCRKWRSLVGVTFLTLTVSRESVAMIRPPPVGQARHRRDPRSGSH